MRSTPSVVRSVAAGMCNRATEVAQHPPSLPSVARLLMLTQRVLVSASTCAAPSKRPAENGTPVERIADRFGCEASLDSHRPATAGGAIQPVDLIEPGGESGAHQQIIMPTTGRHTPAQQLPRSGEDLVGAGGELVAVDAGDVGPTTRPPRNAGVLLDCPPSINSTKAQSRSDSLFLLKRKGETSRRGWWVLGNRCRGGRVTGRTIPRHLQSPPEGSPSL